MSFFIFLFFFLPDSGTGLKFQSFPISSQDSLWRERGSIEDKWLAEDKFWHFSVSLALVGSSYHLFKCRLKEKETSSTFFSLIGTFSLGVVKELWDKKKPNGHFSYRDLIYNLLGIGVGYFLFIDD
jgi:uncharacterized protein YfiM (DUF2279 family)